MSRKQQNKETSLRSLVDTPKGVKTVKMVRDGATYPAPLTADVHPDEVENYKVGGWEILI